MRNDSLLILSFNDWLDRVYPELANCEQCDGEGEYLDNGLRFGCRACSEELREAKREYADQAEKDKRKWAEYQRRMERERASEEIRRTGWYWLKFSPRFSRSHWVAQFEGGGVRIESF